MTASARLASQLAYLGIEATPTHATSPRGWDANGATLRYNPAAIDAAAATLIDDPDSMWGLDAYLDAITTYAILLAEGVDPDKAEESLAPETAMLLFAAQPAATRTVAGDVSWAATIGLVVEDIVC